MGRRIGVGIALLMFVMNTGCISYYRPDPLAGIDMVRQSKRMSVQVSLNRYHATEYFDGEGGTPHTSRKSRPEEKYIREDLSIGSILRPNDWLGIIAVLPITHVYQRGTSDRDEVDIWGVERFWLGMGFTSPHDNRFSILVGGGVPLRGDLGALHNTAEDYDGSARLFIEPIISNGSPPDGMGYYMRVGMRWYLNPEFDRVSGITEIPGELRLELPITYGIRGGLYADARFTILDYAKSRESESRDVVAGGLCVNWQVEPGWCLQAAYRKELFGYKTSAGSSWKVGVTYDFEMPEFAP